jgi:hypothetical protein
MSVRCRLRNSLIFAYRIFGSGTFRTFSFSTTQCAVGFAANGITCSFCASSGWVETRSLAKAAHRVSKKPKPSNDQP